MSIRSVKKRLRKIESIESERKGNQVILLTREPTEEERKQGGVFLIIPEEIADL
jgi:hypothetical protein